MDERAKRRLRLRLRQSASPARFSRYNVAQTDLGERPDMRVRLEIVFALAFAGFLALCSAPPTALASGLFERVRAAAMFVSAGVPTKNYSVSNASMMPTLAQGDEVLADLRESGRQPQRGELIVYWLNSTTPYVKRVIGLPGDRIALRAGRIILNGEEIAQQAAGAIESDNSGRHEILDLFTESPAKSRPYKIARMSHGDGFMEDIPETVVPSEHLYLLGDNRDNSLDSRMPQHGLVEIRNVIGRVVYRLQPNSEWLVPRATVAGLSEN